MAAAVPAGVRTERRADGRLWVCLHDVVWVLPLFPPPTLARARPSSLWMPYQTRRAVLERTAAFNKRTAVLYACERAAATAAGAAHAEGWRPAHGLRAWLIKHATRDLATTPDRDHVKRVLRSAAADWLDVIDNDNDDNDRPGRPT